MDLNNIVGFKAVDKNGNERQVTVDEMTELVSARIVSAASEISTFAAATAAGTDEFEDQLPQSDTFSWLRTLDGSKNPTLTSSSAAAKVLGELLPLATNETKGLASMNMCIAYVGEGPVICIKPTNLKTYYYTLLTVTVYENGKFKKIDLAVYNPAKGKGHKCSILGDGNVFVKEDSDYNLYIYNASLNNATYCVSIIGCTKNINLQSITVEGSPASVLNGLILNDVATM